jgi:excisionase family DNA binding protein
MTDQLLTAPEVAERFGVAARTVNAWARKGWLLAVRPGKQWRFRADDVAARLGGTGGAR